MSDKSAPGLFADKGLNPFRPLDTLEDALTAQRAPVGIAVMMVIAYAISSMLAAWGGRAPVGAGGLNFLIGAAVVVTVCGALGAWVWFRRSLIAAILLASLYGLDVILTAIASGRLPISLLGFLFLYIAFACTTLGIRGHQAAHRIRTAPPDPEVFS